MDVDRLTGTLRTEAPTASRDSQHLLCQAVASNAGWISASAYVSPAFLKGDRLEREVYFEAPKHGPRLPVPEGCWSKREKVSSGSLTPPGNGLSVSIVLFLKMATWHQHLIQHAIYVSKSAKVYVR